MRSGRKCGARGNRRALAGLVAGIAGTATLVAGLTFAPQEAAAQRPDLRQMSCAQARNLVARRGAVVMTTGRYTYERFVAGPRWCDHWETVAPRAAATRDNPRCVVGYICETPLFRPFGWDR
ncbi:hypothetical protein [Stappia sp.]|uniref:hypothetical protein n=1 Tax=Stappia sp. TaxID=1870903 RepID=UPI003A98F431